VAILPGYPELALPDPAQLRRQRSIAMTRRALMDIRLQRWVCGFFGLVASAIALAWASRGYHELAFASGSAAAAAFLAARWRETRILASWRDRLDGLEPEEKAEQREWREAWAGLDWSGIPRRLRRRMLAVSGR
jgi:hypothetical protein